MKDRPLRAPRLFVDADLAAGERVVLPDEVAHHAVTVLRLRQDEPVVLFNGRGGEYEARLHIAGRSAQAELGQHRALERESPLAITLVQGISSADRMDFTVQKAVELGVAAIHPVLTSRSVVRLSGDRGEKKLTHWQRIVVAACEQSGRNRIPQVVPPCPLPDYCGRPGDGLKLLLSPAAPARLVDAARGVTSLSLAVGPEAGFSDEEEGLLERAGYLPVRLGPRTLRTETAGLAALAALNALAGDF
jgi:16S rRNA (uracil1498-N3)-methyltransferase